MPLIELSEEELALLLDSLEEAAFFRDARSNVVRSAVRRKERRVGSMQAGAPQGEDHRRKAREYAALAVKLRAQERRS